MEGVLYKELKGNSIQCIACNRYCTIKEGESGKCGVRKNIKGKLDLIVYGRPCAIWADPIEKKPLFHFLPGTRSYSLGTYGCNFSCSFCQNYDISQAHIEFEKRFEKMVKALENIPPSRIVKDAIGSNCKSISYTYTEPTIFSEYAHDIGIIARKENLKNVYVTNGYETKEAWDYANEFLDAANIDLKGDEEFYQNLCGKVSEKPVKESIKYAKDLGIWVEVTTLIIPGKNDDVEFLKKTADFLYSVDAEIPWHVTAFHPDYKMKNIPAADLEILVRARSIGEEAGLKNIYCGNVISKYENTVCTKCKKNVIERWGFEVWKNNLNNGKCSHCGNKIGGVFE